MELGQKILLPIKAFLTDMMEYSDSQAENIIARLDEPVVDIFQTISERFMPYRIVASMNEHTPTTCQQMDQVVIYGTSDVKSPPHALTQEEFDAGGRCQCVLVETEHV